MRVTIVFCLFLLAACGAPSCEAGLPAFAKTLDPLAREWDDANKVAASTPRAALAVQIGNLQSVRRRVQDIEAPACGADMKRHLVSAMDATIDAYVAFLGQKTNTEVQAAFTKASTEMKAYQEAVVKAGTHP